MSFLDRFLPGMDPQEPASPPPFAVGDRVVVSLNATDPDADLDARILDGQHGEVVDVWFTADPEDEWGPWVVKVHLDGDTDPMKFHAGELVRETERPAVTGPLEVRVSQPEDDAEKGGIQYWPLNEDGGDVDQPVPYAPNVLTSCSLVGPESEQLPPVTQHDNGVSAEARQIERMFADSTEKSLREWTAQRKDAS